MLETGTSGLMSGEGKRAAASRPRTAPFLDSTPSTRHSGDFYTSMAGVLGNPPKAAGQTCGTPYWSRILDMPADDEAFPWDRLWEASDKIGPAVAKLVAYKNTAAAYSIAAVHVASLREASLPYSVRPTGDNEHPFGLFVLPDQFNRAREIIGGVGLGSDIDWAA